jgi:hypothetical protein
MTADALRRFASFLLVVAAHLDPSDTLTPDVVNARQSLKAKGWSYLRAAKELGCTCTHLTEVLTGRRVSRDLLSRITALPKSQTIPKRKRGPIRFRGLTADAAALGVNRTTLHRVLTGQWKLPTLAARYAALKATQP